MCDVCGECSCVLNGDVYACVLVIQSTRQKKKQKVRAAPLNFLLLMVQGDERTSKTGRYQKKKISLTSGGGRSESGDGEGSSY